MNVCIYIFIYFFLVHFRNQKAVMNLLEELEVEIYDQWDTGSKIMQSSDGIIKKYSGSLPPLWFLALLDMWWFIRKVIL